PSRVEIIVGFLATIEQREDLIARHPFAIRSRGCVHRRWVLGHVDLLKTRPATLRGPSSVGSVFHEEPCSAAPQLHHRPRPPAGLKRLSLDPDTPGPES